MTAQQISKALRELAPHVRSTDHRELARKLELFANDIDELARTQPISQSVQESAQRAADEIYQPTERLGLLAHAQRINEISEIILSHLAPHCGVNQEMKKCLWLMLDGTRPDYSDLLTAISSRQTEINRAWKAYEAAEAVQTQIASLDKELAEALRMSLNNCQRCKGAGSEWTESAGRSFIQPCPACKDEKEVLARFDKQTQAQEKGTK